jgi:anti-sigma B factor antagonist
VRLESSAATNVTNQQVVMFTPESPRATDSALLLIEEPLEPSGIVLTASGELDIATAPLLRAPLNAAIDAGVRRIIVDLLGLTFLDSVALAALLQIRRRLGHDGRMAVVVAPDSYVRLIFEVAGMPQCVDVVETREQAVARVTA